MFMNKSVIAAGALVVLAASEESIYDVGLSLLQTRAQKQEVALEPGADGSVYTVQGGGTECKPEEVITFAKCNEVQQRQIVSNNPAADIKWVANERGHGGQPAGCFKAGTGIYFNDEPVGGSTCRGCLPICSPNGGRAAEIVAQGISCFEPTCKQGRGEPREKHGQHYLTWDDSVVMPELYMGEKGGVCKEACELLTYEQCSKATDMGLIDAMNPGNPVGKGQPIHSPFGFSRVFGTAPSACSANCDSRYSICGMFWNSIDTPSGINAKPGGNGEPWVSDSGVGTGWNLNAPVCGVCTTTTTTEAPVVAEVPEEDEAGAVGDPHMRSVSGTTFDLAEADLQRHGH